MFTVMVEIAHEIDDKTHCGFNTDRVQTPGVGADAASFSMSYVSTLITLPIGRP